MRRIDDAKVEKTIWKSAQDDLEQHLAQDHIVSIANCVDSMYKYKHVYIHTDVHVLLYISLIIVSVKFDNTQLEVVYNWFKPTSNYIFIAGESRA